MLGQKIKDLRVSKGLKTQDLAVEIGVNQSTISNYESGLRTPSLEVLLKIAEFFEVSTDYLLGHNPDQKLYKEIEAVLAYKPELLEFFKGLKDREDLKRLFKESKDLSPDTVKKVIEIIKIMEEE